MNIFSARKTPIGSELSPVGRAGIRRTLFWAVVIFGVALRLGSTAVAGNHLMAPWSGGGDQHQYIILASNLIAGDGFTYNHQPTAARAPLYPLMLVPFLLLFGSHWIIAVRVFQFLIGLLTAWMCGQLAGRLFGPAARGAAIVAALFMPMLFYFQNEILTECITSFLVVLFFLCLVEALSHPRILNLILVGFFAGAAALARFNAAVLALIAVALVFGYAKGRERWRRAAWVAAACLITLSPWLIRTTLAFHGRALYSTQGGFAAVEGILMPLGRTQPAEMDAIERTLHWGMWDVETNAPSRLRLPAEPELNRQAWSVARGLWREQSWRMRYITLQKLSAFWLSTDQVFWTQGLSWPNRMARWAGVGFYWIMLLLTVAGWLRLRRTNAKIARALLFYAIVVTLVHLPVVMNTRLRSPLLDPLLAALAGGGLLSLIERFSLPALGVHRTPDRNL